jgi:hypothetical protein
MGSRRSRTTMETRWRGTGARPSAAMRTRNTTSQCASTRARVSTLTRCLPCLSVCVFVCMHACLYARMCTSFHGAQPRRTRCDVHLSGVPQTCPQKAGHNDADVSQAGHGLSACARTQCIVYQRREHFLQRCQHILQRHEHVLQRREHILQRCQHILQRHEHVLQRREHMWQILLWYLSIGLTLTFCIMFVVCIYLL